MSLLLSKYVLFQMCKLFIGVYRLSLPYFDMASCVKFIKLFWPETFLNSSCLEILFVNLHWQSLKIKSCTDCYVFSSTNLINTKWHWFYFQTFSWLFWLNDFILFLKAAFLLIFSFACYLNPTTKQNFHKSNQSPSSTTFGGEIFEEIFRILSIQWKWQRKLNWFPSKDETEESICILE